MQTIKNLFISIEAVVVILLLMTTEGLLVIGKGLGKLGMIIFDCYLSFIKKLVEKSNFRKHKVNLQIKKVKYLFLTIVFSFLTSLFGALVITLKFYYVLPVSDMLVFICSVFFVVASIVLIGALSFYAATLQILTENQRLQTATKK